MNGKKPLTIGFKTFCESTSLDYNKGTYVSHPSPKAVKAELARIKTDEVLINRNPILKTAFPMAWRILFTFVIQFLGGNYSSTKQVNSIQQLIAYYLTTRTKVDIGEIIYSDLITRLTYKSRQKYVSYPRFVSCALEVLLGTEYTQDDKFGSLPNVLSNSNFTKDLSKVIPIEFTASMIAGPDASRTLPQNRKQPKTQKRPVVQATETSPTKKVLTEDSNKTSQSPQAKQLIPKIWRETYNSLLRDLILHLMRALVNHNLCLRVKLLIPKTRGEMISPLIRDCLSWFLMKVLVKPSLYLKGHMKAKTQRDLNHSLIWNHTPLVTVLSRTNAKYQVDQTQSTRFEVSVPDQHQSKTSFEVELDFEPLKLTTIADIQALLGASDDDLKEDSEDDVFEAGEEMDEYIQEADTEEHQTHLSTKTPTKEPYKSISLHHQAGINLNPPKLRRLMHQTQSPHHEKHEEATAFYADLKLSLEDFIHTSFTKYEKTDTALRNFQQILNLFKTDHITSMRRILVNLKEVEDAVKEDPALNNKVLEATEAYTKNSTNVTEPLTPVKTFDFSGLKSIVESLKATMDSQNDHLATWAKLSTNLAWSVGPRLTKIVRNMKSIGHF
ncbi:hypothetical protein Tco_0296420 [Tanacetum coccineum]